MIRFTCKNGKERIIQSKCSWDLSNHGLHVLLGTLSTSYTIKIKQECSALLRICTGTKCCTSSLWNSKSLNQPTVGHICWGKLVGSQFFLQQEVSKCKKKKKGCLTSRLLKLESACSLKWSGLPQNMQCSVIDVPASQNEVGMNHWKHFLSKK